MMELTKNNNNYNNKNNKQLVKNDNNILISEKIEYNDFNIYLCKSVKYYIFYIKEKNTNNLLVENTFLAPIPIYQLKENTYFISVLIDRLNNAINISYELIKTNRIIESLINSMIDDNIANVKNTEGNINNINDIKVLEQINQEVTRLNEYVKADINLKDSSIEAKIRTKKSVKNTELLNLLLNYYDVYRDYDTNLVYYKTKNGFEVLSIKELSNIFNQLIGSNKISFDQMEKILTYITEPIEIDYNCISFKNGLLYTDTNTFKTDKTKLNKIPKLSTDLNYIPNAEAEFKTTELYNNIELILNNPKLPNNSLMYYKSLGNSLMGINEIQKLIVLVGKPATGKSTLLNIVKRIFNYSEVKLHQIAKHERFSLIPCLKKDVNIDDDLQGAIIKDIGYLNSFISGNGGYVEFKNNNLGSYLNKFNTPKFWGASNRLPPVIGDGFNRRLLLILTNDDNVYENNELYQLNLVEGSRDKELSLLISYAYQTYFKTRGEPLLTQEQKYKMLDLWDWKSYPQKQGVKMLFKTTDDILQELYNHPQVLNDTINVNQYEIRFQIYGDINNVNKDLSVSIVNNNKVIRTIRTYTSLQDVNKAFKKFDKWALDSNLIFEEQANFSIKSINNAMDTMGFITNRRYYNTPGGQKAEKVYLDCILKKEWK